MNSLASAIETLKAVSTMNSGHSPWELIESGELRIPSISRATAGQRIPLTPATMKPGQLRIYNTIKDAMKSTNGTVMVMILKYRQGGISTIVREIFFSLGVCHDGWSQAVIADTSDRANLMQRIDRGLQQTLEDRGTNLSKYKTSNRRELIFEDSESITRYMSSGETTLGISEQRNGFHGTEIPYWQSFQRHWGDINPSIHDLPGNLVVLESTAFGSGDAWHQLWLAAIEKKSKLITIFLPWYEDPDLVMDAPEDFEPDEWECTLVKRYDLSREQIYWYHIKLYDPTGFRGNKALMREKYPFTWQEAFQASGSIVMDSIKDSLNGMMATLKPGKIAEIGGTNERPRLMYCEEGKLEIFHERVPGRSYVGYSDVGEGLKDTADSYQIIEGEKITTSYSTCIVRDAETWELCALMECRYPEDVFEPLARKLMYYYNTALWGIEIPGPGRSVIAYARAAEYPNLYLHKWRDASNELREMSEYGFRNDMSTKPYLESCWEEMIREKPQLAGSRRIVGQALTYIRNPKTAKHQPRSGCFSDLLLADMGAVQLLKVFPRQSLEKAKKKLNDYRKDQDKQTKRRSKFR